MFKFAFLETNVIKDEHTIMEFLFQMLSHDCIFMTGVHSYRMPMDNK